MEEVEEKILFEGTTIEEKLMEVDLLGEVWAMMTGEKKIMNFNTILNQLKQSKFPSIKRTDLIKHFEDSRIFKVHYIYSNIYISAGNYIKEENDLFSVLKIEKINPSYVFLLDFLPATKENPFIPAEISCLKVEFSTGKLLDKFHSIIPTELNEKDSLDFENYFHGIPCSEVEEISVIDLKKVLRSFFEFIEFDFEKKKTKNLIYSYNLSPKLFQWMFEILDEKGCKLKAPNLNMLFLLYEPHSSKTNEMVKRINNFIDSNFKCTLHKNINECFYCSEIFNYATLHCLQKGIDNSFESLLEIEVKEYMKIDSIIKINEEKLEKVEKMKISDIVKYSQISIKPKKRFDVKIEKSEIDELIKILPKEYSDFLQQQNLDELIELELDYNRLPKAHFSPNKKLIMSKNLVTKDDLKYITDPLEILSNNRSGIKKYLHRISVIRGINNQIVGVTMRVGKPIFGLASIISDILDEGKSILFLGTPGCGKTSKKYNL